MRTGPSPSRQRRARDDGGLGGAVGVPHLAARRPASRSASSGGQASPPKISSRTCSSASAGHSAASVGTVETTVMPRATSHGPRSMPVRTSDARRGHQAGAVPPGQPHLLAGGVEGDGQAGEHAVAGADRLVLQEHSRLGVDERGGVAVGDGDALGGAGGARGEDDPRVVAARAPRRATARRARARGSGPPGDDADHTGLAEHQFGALVRDRRRRRGRRPRRPPASTGSRRTARSCPTASGRRPGRRGRCPGRRATRRCPRYRRSARRR